MKAIIASVLLAIGFSSSAQMTLNTGESCTYHFTSLSFAVTSANSTPYVRCTVNMQDYSPDVSLRCELWEGKTEETLKGSKVMNAEDAIFTIVTNLWSDLEGSIRLTALTGAVTITKIDLFAVVQSFYGPQYNAIYTRIIDTPPVPPRLTILQSSNSVQLSWWTNVSAGYILESSDLAGASWETNYVPTIVAGRNIVSLCTTGSTKQFFRLSK